MFHILAADNAQLTKDSDRTEHPAETGLRPGTRIGGNLYVAIYSRIYRNYVADHLR